MTPVQERPLPLILTSRVKNHRGPQILVNKCEQFLQTEEMKSLQPQGWLYRKLCSRHDGGLPQHSVSQVGATCPFYGHWWLCCHCCHGDITGDAGSNSRPKNGVQIHDSPVALFVLHLQSRSCDFKLYSLTCADSPPVKVKVKTQRHWSNRVDTVRMTAGGTRWSYNGKLNLHAGPGPGCGLRINLNLIIAMEESVSEQDAFVTQQFQKSTSNQPGVTI